MNGEPQTVGREPIDRLATLEGQILFRGKRETLQAALMQLCRYNIINAIDVRRSFDPKQLGGGAILRGGDIPPASMIEGMIQMAPALAGGSEDGDYDVGLQSLPMRDVAFPIRIAVLAPSTPEAPQPAFDTERLDALIAEQEEFSEKAIDALPIPERKHLGEFASYLVERLQCDTQVFRSILREFGLFKSGAFPAKALIHRLRLQCGLKPETAVQLIEMYLSFDRDGQLEDKRPSFTIRERATFMRKQEAALSPEGTAFLERLERAVAANDEAALTELEHLMPSVQNPHLEYFKPLEDQQLAREYGQKMACLRTVEGCSRHCQHCYLGPDPRVQAMPYHRILQFLEAQGEVGEFTRDQLCTYYDSDCLDYYDPLFNADIGDVVKEVFQRFPAQMVHITTRGHYSGDAIGARALEKLGELHKQRRQDKLKMRISVDLFDVFKKDLASYIVRMSRCFNTFEYDSGSIIVAQCWDNQNQAMTKAVSEFVYSLAQSQWHYESGHVAGIAASKGGGRGTRLDTKSEYDVEDCMYGYHLLPSGTAHMKSKILNAKTPVVHEFSQPMKPLWNAAEVYTGLTPKPRSHARRGHPFQLSEDGYYVPVSEQEKPGRVELL